MYTEKGCQKMELFLGAITKGIKIERSRESGREGERKSGMELLCSSAWSQMCGLGATRQ